MMKTHFKLANVPTEILTPQPRMQLATSNIARDLFSIIVEVDVQRIRIRLNGIFCSLRDISPFWSATGSNKPLWSSRLTFQCCHRVGLLPDILHICFYRILALLTPSKCLRGDEADIGTVNILGSPKKVLMFDKYILILSLYAPLDAQHLLECILVSMLHFK